jgi:hypothetical protein
MLVWIPIIASVCAGVMAVLVCDLIDRRAATALMLKRTKVDTLKDGLLSMALLRLRADDVNRSDRRYSNYDGTELPPFSGMGGIVHLCMSYILDVEEFRRGPWYSKFMEDHIMAIDAYLMAHFDTDERVVGFLQEMADTLFEKAIVAAPIE